MPETDMILNKVKKKTQKDDNKCTLLSGDLEQPVEEDDADELVLCVSLTDDQWQCDGGRELIAAVGLRQTRLSEEEAKRTAYALATNGRLI